VLNDAVCVPTTSFLIRSGVIHEIHLDPPYFLNPFP